MKKRNPQDATLRNIRALKKEISLIRKQIRLIADVLGQLVKEKKKK